MKNALLRFVGLIIATCAVIFSILIIIRWMGAGQQYAPVKHALINDAPMVIVEMPTDELGPQPQSLTAISNIAKQCPSCIIKVDSRLSLDGKAYVFAEDDLKPETGTEGFFSLKTSSEIGELSYTRDESSRVLPLERLLEELPDTAFYVVIHSRDASNLRNFLGALEARKSNQNLILGSPYRQILKEARKERPTWLFSTPPSYLMRIQVLGSLMIETMADIWPDILIFDPSAKTERPTAAVIGEYQNRKKTVIVRTDALLDEYPTAQFGLMTKNLDLAIEMAQKDTSN
ncbi:MAG: hypothetical protein HRT45_14995 [Bdellovibrionales bacterium]|nr:hypothetical protein [Bdellovibrionales bacterium]